MPASSAGDSFSGTIPESEEVDHGGLDVSDDDDCDEANAHVEAFVDEVDIPSTKDEQDYITVSEYVREGPFTWHTLWEPMSRPGCDDESWSRFAQGLAVGVVREVTPLESNPTRLEVRIRPVEDPGRLDRFLVVSQADPRGAVP